MEGGWWGRVIRAVERWKLKKNWIGGLQEEQPLEWKRVVREIKWRRVQDRWEKEVLKRGSMREGYRGVKKKWGLSEVVKRRGTLADEVMKLRGGVSSLEVDRGRWGAEKVKRHERICGMCGVAVGDLWHVVGECGRLNERRREGIEDWMKRAERGERKREAEVWQTVVEWMRMGNAVKVVKLMLGGKEGEKWGSVSRVCTKWIGSMLKERRRILENVD